MYILKSIQAMKNYYLFVIMFFASILTFSACQTKYKVKSDDFDYIDVTDYGISNNSSRDQTAAIQKLFVSKRRNGKFFFPRGEYHVSNLDIYEGIEILGEEDTWFVKLKNCNTWSRMFNTIKYKYSGVDDSRPIKFSGINIDGNFKNQGEYKKYQLEHQAMIFLIADRKKPGRLKVEINNCNFVDGVSDAISIHWNVDAKITNCQMTDVFRGGITVTGGYSKVIAKNIDIGGKIHKSGVDIEVDAEGYGNTKASVINFSNMILEGDFDVAAQDGGVSTFDSITVKGYPYNFYAPGGTIIVTNSSFISSEIYTAKLYFPTNIQFENCDFTIIDSDSERDLGAFLVYMNNSYRTSYDLRLKFKKCKFINKVTNLSKVVKGIYILPDDYSRNNMLVMEDCEFIGNFDYNIFVKQGANVALKNVVFDGKVGLKLHSVVNTNNYRYKADLDNVSMRDVSMEAVSYFNHPGNQILLKNMSDRFISGITYRNYGKTKIIEQ